MIRLITICILFIVLRLTVFGQTAYWTEDFSSAQGWTLQDNWSLEENKIQFYWSPVAYNFDLSATSPLISLNENTSDLVVKQYIDVYIGTNDEFAEISIITDSGETILWSYSLASGNWGSITGSNLTIPVHQFAGMDVRFRFRTYGLNSLNWDQWDIFSVQVMAYFDYDLAVSGISGPVSLVVMESGTWKVDIINLGVQPIASFTVSIFENKSNSLIGTTTVTDIINPGQTISGFIDWTSNAVLNTTFTASVSAAGDMFSGNDKFGTWFVRVRPDLDINILVWNKDNGISTVLCPENGDLIKPSVGLTRVLQAAAIEYTLVNTLPDNLNGYDIVFATMGCFCVD